LLAFGASLLCKPIWIVLPLLLLLWDYYPLQRLDWPAANARLKEIAPFFLIGCASHHGRSCPMNPRWDTRELDFSAGSAFYRRIRDHHEPVLACHRAPELHGAAGQVLRKRLALRRRKGGISGDGELE